MAKKATVKINKINNPNKLKFNGGENTVKDKYKMLATMEKSLCIVSTAAKKAGIERTTHYKWLGDDENYKSAIEELDNMAIDFTESMMYKRIREGSDQLIKYVMSTKGAKRGYREKTAIELTGKDGAAIESNAQLSINIMSTATGISATEREIQDEVNRELGVEDENQ